MSHGDARMPINGALAPRLRAVLVPIAMILVAVAAILAAGQVRSGQISDPLGASGVPVAMSIVLLALAAVELCRLRPVVPGLIPDGPVPEGALVALRPLAALAMGALWLVLLPLIGFLVSSALAILGLLLAQGGAVRRSLAIAGSASLIAFIVFNRLFGIVFPPGPIDRFVMLIVPAADFGG